MTGDPRAARTRERLRTALLDACATRPLDAVSVSEVVRAAGVGRATFYLHYEDLRALAVDSCACLVRGMVDAVHATTLPGASRPPAELVALLAAVRSRAPLYGALLGPAGGGPLGELLHTELRTASLTERRRRLGDRPGHEAAASAVAAAFTGLLTDWVADRVPGEADEVAAQIWTTFWAIHTAF